MSNKNDGFDDFITFDFVSGGGGGGGCFSVFLTLVCIVVCVIVGVCLF